MQVCVRVRVCVDTLQFFFCLLFSTLPVLHLSSLLVQQVREFCSGSVDNNQHFIWNKTQGD